MKSVTIILWIEIKIGEVGNMELTEKEFIDYCNKKRLEHKNKWFMQNLIINNKIVSIKFFNTWIQILKTEDNINYSGAADIKVREFKEKLREFYIKELRR